MSIKSSVSPFQMIFMLSVAFIILSGCSGLAQLASLSKGPPARAASSALETAKTMEVITIDNQVVLVMRLNTNLAPQSSQVISAPGPGQVVQLASVGHNTRSGRPAVVTANLSLVEGSNRYLVLCVKVSPKLWA